MSPLANTVQSSKCCIEIATVKKIRQTVITGMNTYISPALPDSPTMIVDQRARHRQVVIFALPILCLSYANCYYGDETKNQTLKYSVHAISPGDTNNLTT